MPLPAAVGSRPLCIAEDATHAAGRAAPSNRSSPKASTDATRPRATSRPSRRSDAAITSGSRTGGSGSRIVRTSRSAWREEAGELLPRATRAGAHPLELLRRLRDVAVQHDRGAVLERVGHDVGAADPLEAVRLEAQLADRRRGDGQGAEPGAVIVDEARQRGLRRRRGAAVARRVLEDLHVEAGLREMEAADQAVVACSDDEDARGHGRGLPGATG